MVDLPPSYSNLYFRFPELIPPPPPQIHNFLITFYPDVPQKCVEYFSPKIPRRDSVLIPKRLNASRSTESLIRPRAGQLTFVCDLTIRILTSFLPILRSGLIMLKILFVVRFFHPSISVGISNDTNFKGTNGQTGTHK